MADGEMAVAIHLLGVPRVERDGAALPAPRGHKVWALLAYLIRSRAGASRKHLAALPFEDAEDPLAALRWNLSELRRLFGNECLRGDVPTLSLNPSSCLGPNRCALKSIWRAAITMPRRRVSSMRSRSVASSAILAGKVFQLAGSVSSLLHAAKHSTPSRI